MGAVPEVGIFNFNFYFGEVKYALNLFSLKFLISLMLVDFLKLFFGDSNFIFSDSFLISF